VRRDLTLARSSIFPSVRLSGITLLRITPGERAVETVPFPVIVAVPVRARLWRPKWPAQRAQVVLVLDISASMNALYPSGVVQRMIARILGLAVTFDNDGHTDLLPFGTNAYLLPPVTLDEIEGYVERVILAQYKIREATNYAPPLRLLLNKYRAPQPAPVFVIFLTDGGNADRRESAEVIREMSHQPVFVQFVGIGKEDFPFLHKLDE